jgi:hypothetical protein
MTTAITPGRAASVPNPHHYGNRRERRARQKAQRQESRRRHNEYRLREKERTHHGKLWGRFLSRFDRSIPADHPMREDRRYWEAHVARIDLSEFDLMFWFFGITADERLDLCILARTRQRTERQMNIARKRNRAA